MVTVRLDYPDVLSVPLELRYAIVTTEDAPYEQLGRIAEALFRERRHPKAIDKIIAARTALRHEGTPPRRATGI